MATFDVAHIQEQGVDLIIVLLDPSFGLKAPIEQQRVAAALQVCATTAGLLGVVVPVWDDGGGRMAYLAPPTLHLFFSSIDLTFVAASINGTLTCG